MSSEEKNLMHSVMNSGYRRGQTIRRATPGGYEDFPTYCPKAFFLIGAVNDTLRSRSITLHLKRAGAVHKRTKFYFQIAQPQGEAIRTEILALHDDTVPALTETYLSFEGAEFLTDREEEIWTPLFVLCRHFAPTRELELRRIAADMAAEKTAPAMKYKNLLGEEKKAEDEEYSTRLLRDTRLIMNGRNAVASNALVGLLREMPTGPWRKFRGKGLTMNNLAHMLSRFGLHPIEMAMGARLRRAVDI